MCLRHLGSVARRARTFSRLVHPLDSSLVRSQSHMSFSSKTKHSLPHQVTHSLPAEQATCAIRWDLPTRWVLAAHREPGPAGVPGLPNLRSARSMDCPISVSMPRPSSAKPAAMCCSFAGGSPKNFTNSLGAFDALWTEVLRTEEAQRKQWVISGITSGSSVLECSL